MVAFADLDVNEESLFHERCATDYAFAGDCGCCSQACETEPAGEEGIVEEGIEGEE